MSTNRHSEKRRKRNVMLMKLSAAGDMRAFRMLVDENNGWMRAVLTWKLKDEEAAKDISQEVWVKIWQNLVYHRYTENGSAEKWMERILYNELKDFILECKHRIETVQITEELQEFLDDTYGAADKGEQEFEVMQGLEAAEQYMQDLLVRIVNHHLVDGMSNGEIARKEHRSVRQVKEDFYQGMKQLRRNMTVLEHTAVPQRVSAR